MKLVMLSGGVDSTTCLALAKKNYKDVIAISFDYGQRHKICELEASKKIAEFYNVKHRIINLSSIFIDGKSSLTNLSLDVTEGDYKIQENINTEVEFRNGVFLSILASLAMQYNADEIYYGAHKDDSGTIYPDCSVEFLKSINKTIEIGTSNKVKVNAPFINFTKKEIVKLGKELNVPYQMTYSCYNGTIPPCGKCGTCIDRKKAFLENGLSFD